MNNKADILARVCDALTHGSMEDAKRIAQSEYPFSEVALHKKKYTVVQSVEVFVRDGFIDRYSGERLVFPGTLRVLSKLLPNEFPAHPNWKMSASHIVYWELFPTIDHIRPVARGGEDERSNWVTTSMLRNSAKSNWTLDELGWKLVPPGNYDEWDGLTRWFIDHVDADPSLRSDNYIRRWDHAARQVVGRR